MRELAYVEKIRSLTPIPGADKIEKAEVLGWELVVKRGDFKVGDLTIYCEVDSILPQLKCFEFLRQYKFRLRTVRLRKQISQGLALPLSLIKEAYPNIDIKSLKVGQDLTDAMGSVKYDPEAASDVKIEQVKKSWLSRKYSYLKWKLLGFKPAKSVSFPSDVPKKDEERVQKMGSALANREGELVYISEKLEGSSMTVVYRKAGNWLAKLFGRNYVFLVCSRNRIAYNSQKGGETNHTTYQIAEKFNLLEGLKKLNRNIAIQGEQLGGKIQGNVYKLPELSLRVFLMYDLDKKEYLYLDEMSLVADQLGLMIVPILERDVFLNANVKYYVELSKGMSKINPLVQREGLVIRSMNDNFSFKSISPDYLLSQELD